MLPSNVASTNFTSSSSMPAKAYTEMVSGKIGTQSAAARPT